MTDQQHPETLKEQVDRNAQMRGDTVWLISPENGEEVSFAQAQTRIVEIAATNMTMTSRTRPRPI